MTHDWITPDWPAPNRVKALSTTRQGGVSQGVYASLNLGGHVGDDPVAVERNRSILKQQAGLPAAPLWLTQVHGCEVAGAADCTGSVSADAAMADRPGVVCAVMTADCLPVLLCNRGGNEVAAVHAGWRGLNNGVIEAAIDRMQTAPQDLMAWLGPAIGPQAFEVGDEVRQAFLATDPDCGHAFRPSRPGHWSADLYSLAKRRLSKAGVDAAYGGGLCTFSDPQRFFSYRRDGACGRMASLIWIQN